jgi:uracil-DNA glycosylase family 4
MATAVHGSGSQQARVFFLGEAPGEVEEKTGIPFTGKAGAEFDYWLQRTCHLARKDVFVTNLYRYRPPANRDPTPLEIAGCEPDLWRELLTVGPRILATLGRLSTRWALGDWASMEATHGLPHLAALTSPWGEWSGTVVPITHPAAGLHQPTYYAWTVADFEALAEVLAGTRAVHRLDTEPTDYGWHTPADLGRIRRTSLLGLDTEGSPRQPWGLSYSVAPRHGRVIRAGDREALTAFDRALVEQQPQLVLHYAPHDFRVLSGMGLNVDAWPGQVYDTMQLAYLAAQPQGLKTLAYRLCGLRLREYEDLVGEAADRLARGFLEAAATLLAPREGEKPTPILRAVRRSLKSASPRALWGRQREDIREVVAGVCGAMPEASLDEVPVEEALAYACADADATRRVFLVLRDQFDYDQAIARDGYAPTGIPHGA